MRKISEKRANFTPNYGEAHDRVGKVTTGTPYGKVQNFYLETGAPKSGKVNTETKNTEETICIIFE